ncbi:MAG: twin-arginine translocation signal domain-containing protein, partial [Acetobacteraceae bacterium]
MKTLSRRGALGAALGLAASSAGLAQQTWSPPEPAQRCPSRWGSAAPAPAGSRSA